MESIIQNKFENRITSLRKLKKEIKELLSISPSILSIISYRIAIASIGWNSGIIKGLPPSILKKLPKDIRRVLSFYYKLSNELKIEHKRLENDENDSTMSYLIMRKKLISSIKLIKKGLLKGAISNMKEVVDELEKNVFGKKDMFDKQYFKFWDKYISGFKYYLEIFLPMFPNKYNPIRESDFSLVINKTLGLEELTLDYVLTNQIELADETIKEWIATMDKFVNDENKMKMVYKK